MKGKSSWMAILILAILMSAAMGKAALGDQKKIIGWLEKVYLPKYDFAIKTKMDTGAKNSSIHALDVEYVAQKSKLEGARVRFKTIDLKGRYRIIEADMLRQVRVKKPSSESETRQT